MKILKFAVLGIIASLFLSGCVAPHHGGRVSGSVSYDSAGYYGGSAYYDSGYYYDRPYYRSRPVIYNRRPVIIDRRPVVVDRRPVVVRDNHRSGYMHGHARPNIKQNHVQRPPYKRMSNNAKPAPNFSKNSGAHRLAKANDRGAKIERIARDNNSERSRIIPPKDRAYRVADRKR